MTRSAGNQRFVDVGGDELARVAARDADGAIDQAQAGDAMLGGIGGIILTLLTLGN